MARRRARFDPAYLDAARWLPCTARSSAPGFIRFGAPSDGDRVPREGDLEPWQRDTLRTCLDWFEEHMPGCRPPLSAAVLFLRDREREMARHLWELAHLLRDLGVPIDMVAVRQPGRIVQEDAIQVAAVPR